MTLQAKSNQAVTCDQCLKYTPAQYHLTMSDASVRNFCSYNCVMTFQAQFSKGAPPPPAPTPPPPKHKHNTRGRSGKGASPDLLCCWWWFYITPGDKGPWGYCGGGLVFLCGLLSPDFLCCWWWFYTTPGDKGALRILWWWSGFSLWVTVARLAVLLVVVLHHTWGQRCLRVLWWWSGFSLWVIVAKLAVLLLVDLHHTWEQRSLRVLWWWWSGFSLWVIVAVVVG